VAETRRRQIRPDWLGAATYAAALFGIVFGLIRGNPDGWSSAKVVTALAGGVLPLTLFVLLAAPIAGRLTERVPLRLLLALGAALMAVGLGLMTRVAADSRWTVLLLGFIVAGLGTGLFNPPRASAAVATVPEEKLGVGSGVNNTAVQLGLATGIAALGAVFESRVRTVLEGQLAQAAPQLGPRRHELVDQASSGNATQALHALPPDLRAPVADALRVSFVAGFDRILWIAAAIALAGAIISLLLVRQRDLERPTDGDGEDADTDDDRRNRPDVTKKRKEAAMQYVLLIYQGAFWGTVSNLSDDEKNALVAEYGEINHAPGVTPGLPLGLPEDATTVRVQDGTTLTSGGPYIGTEETIAGWYVCEADDLDAAVELASRIPAARRGGAVEVRPVRVYW
jgi:hypothetical protein